MALTMTRTRNQSTLTALVELVAEVHGELSGISQLGAESPEYQTALEIRRRQLEAQRAALYLTLHQFDPELDPVDIGESAVWLKPYGRLGGKPALRRYIHALVDQASRS